MNNKVLILMDMPLFPYRIYCYNGLAERGYDLTVVSASNTDTSVRKITITRWRN